MVFRPLSNPRDTLDQLRDEVNRLFSGVVGNVYSPWSVPTRGQPAVNLWETDDALMAELELPGVANDQIEISVAENELSVKAQRPDVEQPEKTYHRRERPVGTFARVVRLPTPVNADGVTAQLRDGVLSVTLPKAESVRPRKIQVSCGT